MLKDGDKGVVLQRDRKTYGIVPHIPCGVATPDLLRKIADVADKYDVSALKITSAARIAMLGIKEEDVDNVWADLGMDPGRITGVCVRSIKVCPGTAYCRLGHQDSLHVGMLLDKKYHGVEMPGKLKIGVSGCPLQCGETTHKDIGLVGASKGWRLYVGGNGGTLPRIGHILAQRMTTEEVLNLVDRVIEYYRANVKGKERLGRTIERLGLEDMEDAVGL